MNWHLKKADGETVYGPVDEKTLEAWAADGRISPFDKVSSDQKEWKPAPQVDALKMEWTVDLDDGRQFGPLHVLAFRELVRSRRTEARGESPVFENRPDHHGGRRCFCLPPGRRGAGRGRGAALSGQFEVARRAAGELAAQARQAARTSKSEGTSGARRAGTGRSASATGRRRRRREPAGGVIEKDGAWRKAMEQDRARFERRGCRTCRRNGTAREGIESRMRRGAGEQRPQKEP